MMKIFPLLRSLFLVVGMGVVWLSGDGLHAEVPDKTKVEALVKQLGDERFSVRKRALKELLDMGEPVAKQLRQFSNHPDPEIRSRLESLLGVLVSVRRELKWIDPKNLGKPEYRSKTGRTVKLTFRNLTQKPVRIFWVETDGSRTPWRGLLKAGQSAVCARSYTGHVWLITDADKTPLGLYKIDVADPILAVRDKDFKK